MLRSEQKKKIWSDRGEHLFRLLREELVHNF